MKSAPRKAGKKPAVREKRISNIVRPSDLTSKEWQVALRRQAAQKENLIVRQPADEGRYGVYEVSNPLSRSVYKVVYRGIGKQMELLLVSGFQDQSAGDMQAHRGGENLADGPQERQTRGSAAIFIALSDIFRVPHRPYQDRVGQKSLDEASGE